MLLNYLFRFCPETPDRNCWFPIWKAGFFSPGKEIKDLRGGVHRYAAQAKPKIDAARGKKHPFRTETISVINISQGVANHEETHPEGFRIIGCRFVSIRHGNGN